MVFLSQSYTYFLLEKSNFLIELMLNNMIGNIDILVKELCKLPKEAGWVEFKHNNCEPNMVGEDISALANSATLNDRDYAYMIWGIDDTTHEIIGTKSLSGHRFNLLVTC